MTTVPLALPIDNILKFYGDENKRHREELIDSITALKQELKEERDKTPTPMETDEELREEIKDLKEKLESINLAMNSINKIVKPE